MYGPGTGIGPALRKARLHQGKSIEEASRDTRIRAEYLQALEREAFQTLRGDVYVRGFLRSYSTYLGLNSDKVVSVYVRSTGRSEGDVPEPPPVPPVRQPTLHKVLHRRGNWKLAVALAVIGLGVAGSVGLLTRGGSAPPAEPLPQSPVSAAVQEEPVSLSLHAVQPAHTVVVIDGTKTFSGWLHEDETRTFEGTALISVQFTHGKRVDLTVNGRHLGTVGEAGAPYSASFHPGDFRAGASTG